MVLDDDEKRADLLYLDEFGQEGRIESSCGHCHITNTAV